MEPYASIEEAITRANTLRRQHLLLADLEPDPAISSEHQDAATDAERLASQLYVQWNEILVKDMTSWEIRAGVTAKKLKSANALVKRSITELEESVKTVEVIVRSIQRLEAVVGLVGMIAAI